MKKDNDETIKTAKTKKSTKEEKSVVPAKTKKVAKVPKEKAVKEKKVRKPRAPKEPKEKKSNLPSLFKKKYSEKKLNRKILKKLYIPDDKKYIKGLFVQEPSDNPKKPGKFAIPNDRLFDKKEMKRIKTLAKQIKTQKGRIKLLPLIASLSFIVVIVGLFIATKNVFLTKVVRNLFETQFEARCDIGKLDLKLLDSSFTVKKFEIADKNEPMKNLFSFDSLIIDFDLTQLLKAKFVAEELSINEMAVGSDRTYDGTLPEHKLNKIRAKKEKKAKKRAEKQEQIQESLTNATDKVKTNVTDSIIEIFETFNPKSIIERSYAQMITPVVAKKIQDETIVLINKWKDTPDRVMKQVQNVQQAAEDVIYFNYNSIKDDPKKIKDMLVTIDKAIKSIDSVRVETENILGEIETDFSTVQDLGYEIQDALTHDANVAQSEIDKLTSFRLPTGQEFLASTIDIYGYELLGKYYPYMKEGVDKLISLKDRQVPTKKLPKLPKKEKEEKKEIKRAAGRDIYFVRDRNPKFWIKKIAASGFNMSLDVTNIANDMNKTGVPAEAVFAMDYKNLTHGGNVVVDIRTETTNPLVYAEYTCDGASFAHSDNIPGVPQIKSDADYKCSASVVQDNAFVLSGLADLYNMQLSTPAFEPSYIFDIYNSILSRFDSAKVGLDIRISSDGLELHANSDLDQKIAAAFKEEIEARLKVIKENLEKELKVHIQAYADKAQGFVNQFNEIEKKIRASEEKLKNLEAQVEAKRNEFTNKMEEAQQKVQEGIENKLAEEAAKREEKRKQAEEELRRKNEERKQAAEKKAEDALQGIFGGLKRP